jgi:hypothetical protein
MLIQSYIYLTADLTYNSSTNSERWIRRINNLLLILLQHLVFNLHCRKRPQPRQPTAHLRVRKRERFTLLEGQKLLELGSVLFN